MADDGFNSDICTSRRLSCRERTALKERVMARAYEERRRLLHRWSTKITQLLQLACRRVHQLHLAAMRRLVARLDRAAALRELAAMSDRELRDIGISRLEIAAATDAAWPRGDRNPAAIQSKRGETHAEGLLDRPRLCS